MTGGLIALVALITASPIDARGNALFQFFDDEQNLVFHFASLFFRLDFFDSPFPVLSWTSHRDSPVA
jgi:hypothetical protein